MKLLEYQEKYGLIAALRKIGEDAHVKKLLELGKYWKSVLATEGYIRMQHRPLETQKMSAYIDEFSEEMQELILSRKDEEVEI